MSAKSRAARVKAAANGTAETVAPRDLTRIIGAYGASIFGGMLSTQGDDYSPDWAANKRYALIDKMRSRSGIVKGARLALTAPILRASWDVEPADPDDEQSVEQAAAIKDNLLHGLRHGWSHFVRHGLLGIEYGCVPFEILLRDEGQGAPLRWCVDSLLPRHPKTFQSWNVNAMGDLESLEQWTSHPTKGFSAVTIPADHMLVCSWDPEFGEVRGRSIYREIYKHWFSIDVLEQIGGIAAERRGAGITIATIDKEAVEAWQAKVEAAIRTANAHEKSYLVAVKDVVEYAVKGIEGATFDIMGLIEHHELAITRALGVDWLAMTGNSGSQAMHTDKSSLSKLVVENVADWFVDCVNVGLIRRLSGWNFGEDVEPPMLTYSTMVTEDVPQVMAAITAAVSSGAMPRDRDVVDRLRGLADLSPLDDAIEVEFRDGPTRGVSPFDAPGLPPKPDARVAAAARWKAPRPAQGAEAHVNFARLAAELDDTESAIVRRVRPILSGVGDDMIAQAEAAFARGNIGTLSKIEPPEDANADIRDAVSTELAALIKEGRRSVRAEMVAQADDRQPEPTRVREAARVRVRAKIDGPIDQGAEKAVAKKVADWLALQSAAVADTLLARFSSSLLVEIGRHAQFGEIDPKALATFYEGLSDMPLRQSVRLVTSDALAVGRRVEQEQFRDELSYAVYSTMLDGDNVCPKCQRAEGARFVPFSDEFYDAYPPLIDSQKYGSCDGRGNCRCVMIGVLSNEAPALA